MLKSTQTKTFKIDAFLQESKGRDSALVLAQLCRVMEDRLYSTKKIPTRVSSPKRKIAKPTKKSIFCVCPTEKGNGTGFAGSSFETGLVSVQMMQAQRRTDERERAVAQYIVATNKLLKRSFQSTGASWKLFGTLHEHLCPLLRNILRNMSWRDITEDSTLCKSILALFSSWVYSSSDTVKLMLTLLLLDPLVDQQNNHFEVATKLGDCVLATLIAAIDDQAQQFYRLKVQHERAKSMKTRRARVTWSPMKMKMKQFCVKDERGLKEIANKWHALRLRIGELVRIAPVKHIWDAIKLRYCGKKTQALQKEAQDLSLLHFRVDKADADPETYSRALGGLRVTCSNIAKHHLLAGESRFPVHPLAGVPLTLQQFMSIFQAPHTSQISNDPIPPKALRRLQTELSTLASSLPVDLGSSIFVCFDEGQMELLKVAIIGPRNTPYENGFFVFDVRIPPTYPGQPPKMLLRTTGNNMVRFNPNLYEDGHVCLSLLGTWSGPGWDPTYSSLLQVVLSIQSQIFVENPYFNEPGYDCHRDTDRGRQLSDNYDKTIRYMTLRFAILDQLHNPPPGFERVAAAHFNLKAKEIAGQLAEWEKLDPKIDQMVRKTYAKLGLPAYTAFRRKSTKRTETKDFRPKKKMKK